MDMKLPTKELLGYAVYCDSLVYLFYLNGVIRAGVLSTKSKYIPRLGAPLYVGAGERFRPATESDFEHYLVSVPPDFQEAHSALLFYLFLEKEGVPMVVTEGRALFLPDDRNHVLFENGDLYEFVHGRDSGNPLLRYFEKRPRGEFCVEQKAYAGPIVKARVVRQGGQLLWAH